MRKLFTPIHLGNLVLRNRVVMAPMTRSRAIGNVANDLMAKYYADRATAGLIITEGTSPSPNGLGYARIPGLFDAEQADGWKKVTSAVHAEDGRIFVQLMHTGRTSHPLNMREGTRVVSSSPLRQSGTMFTDARGLQEYPVPEEMTKADIVDAIEEHVRSAELAVNEAGFDGVELHGANGYLIEQFLNPNINKRTDEFGGSDANRMRFALEIALGVARKIGGARLGMRVSPYGANGDAGAFPGVDDFYAKLARELSALDLAYIHVFDHSAMGAPAVSPAVKKNIRENFQSGRYILSGGYDAASAERDLVDGLGDLVAFGRPYIANPQLVEKMIEGRELRAPDLKLAYTPGPEGYTDYPRD